MSAFIVSKAHIHAILSTALDLHACGVTDDTATEIGRRLLGENVRSVVHRYRLAPLDPERSGYEQAAGLYVFRYRSDVSLVTAAQLADSLEYQSCETDDYRSTQAAEFVSGLRSALLRRLPGYDAAPWCLDDPAPRLTVIAGGL